MEISRYISRPKLLNSLLRPVSNAFLPLLKGATSRFLRAVSLGLGLWLSASPVLADNGLTGNGLTEVGLTDNSGPLPLFEPASFEPTSQDAKNGSFKRLDLRRPVDPLFGPAWALRPSVSAAVRSAAEDLPAEDLPANERSSTRFRLHSSSLARYQIDQGTRVTGWKLRDDVFFGKSKGDLKGVALVWQRSQTDQVSLSGRGLRLSRRIN